MWRWIVRTWRTARTWFQVRIGLARGQWQRGVVHAPEASLLPRLPLGRWWLGHSWHYGLYCPAGIEDRDEAPLIVLLHGCRQNALRFAVASGWTAYANRARVRLLCPSQRLRANPLGCWNWFLLPAQRGGGELAVALGAIDAVAQRCAIAADSTSVVGLSAGGAMAALLAFHHPDRFAAAVAVAASPLLGPANMQNPRDVMRHGLRVPPASAIELLPPCAPLAVIHGELDRLVSLVCGAQLIEQVVASHRREVVESHLHPDQSIRTIEYRAGGRLVARHIAIPDLRHEWTGGPGGHAYCEAHGPSLVALCTRFIVDAAMPATHDLVPGTELLQ
jgi:poly(hydroxyalkanoate) depolymerase family esterase